MQLEIIRRDIPQYISSGTLFFNSAGSSIMPHSVVEAIHRVMKKEEEIGGYEVEELLAREFDTLYLEAAKLINTTPENIAFAHDATDAFIKAISSFNFKSGDTIITTQNDYSSNQIIFISLQKRYGIEVKFIKPLKNGDLDLNNLKELITKHNPVLVSVAHVPTNSGIVQDVESVGKICGNYGIPYIVDACQSVGLLVVDVNKIQCDFLTTTGRKFLRGPRGTGFLYVSDRVLKSGRHPLMIDCYGASWYKPDDFSIIETAKRFERWERPYALMAGLTEALRYLNKLGIEEIMAYNKIFTQRLRENIGMLKGIKLYDRGSEKCSIITLRKEGMSLEEMSGKLKKNNVLFTVSRGPAGIIDFTEKQIDGAIRISPHYFNTNDEADKLVEILDKI